MSDTPVILSISMLISGREEMKKSLDSLHYFTEAFPCEVILVDTGCNVEQRALAEKYADKIIDFEWCNDFAAARNAGLREARGEWFMYLDDDEWFDNPRQIVEFFTSGEYKNYISATYVQRNYTDYQGIRYNDYYPSRLAKMGPGVKFVGKIHEYLESDEKPQKKFTDFVHHYGYVFKNDEEKVRHGERNIIPLLELRKEHPGEPRWMCQLAQEYFALHDYERVFQICKEGLAEWERLCNEIYYVPAHIGGLYVYLLIALETLGRYKEEEWWLQRAFMDPNVLLDRLAPTRAFLCLLGTKLYDNLKDYRKSRDYLRRYIDYAKRLKDDRTALEAGAALIVVSVFQKTLLYSTILNCLEAAIRTEDHQLAEDAFYMMDWQNSELLGQNDSEKEIVDAFCCVPYHPSWVKILQTLVSRPNGMGEMMGVFLDIENEYRQQGGAIGGEKLSRLYCLVAALDYEHSYVLSARILCAEHRGKSETGRKGTEAEIAAMFEELFEKYSDHILAVGTEVWNVAERQGIALKAKLLQMDYRNWKRMLQHWCRVANLWEIRQWEERLAGWKGQEDAAGEVSLERPALHFDLFAVKCLEGYLRRYKEACPGMEKLEQMLWKYADGVLTLYTPYYKEIAFREMPEILPDEAQLALNLKELQQSRLNKNDLKALESARKCLGICPAVEEAVDAYAKMLRDDVQKRDREADDAQAELRRLIATLKKAARMQIDAGELQAAKDILLQVQQCVPDDREVKELLERVAGDEKAGNKHENTVF